MGALWDCMDTIGVNSFWPLRPKQHTVPGLIEAWQPIKEELAALSKTHAVRTFFFEHHTSHTHLCWH